MNCKKTNCSKKTKKTDRRGDPNEVAAPEGAVFEGESVREEYQELPKNTHLQDAAIDVRLSDCCGWCRALELTHSEG
jgi:hypothetical protein